MSLCATQSMSTHDETVHVRSAGACPLCHRDGRLLHRGLRDVLYGTPGAWDMRQCPDPHCGLAWLDPMPLAEEIARAYDSYYTHGREAPRHTLARRAYGAVRDGFARRALGYSRGIGPEWFRLLAPLAHLHPGGADVISGTVMFLPGPTRLGERLLEVGCGNGTALERMRHLGWDVEGIDFDPAAASSARSLGLTVHVGDVADQHLPERSFDAVYLGHVLEHVPDPIALLRACRRLLKNGATAIAVTPNTLSWGHQKFGHHWRGLEVPRHLHLFSMASTRRCFEEAGFRIERITTLARGAGYILTESDRLTSRGAKRNRKGMASALTGRGKWLYYQLAERALVATGRPVGEEILVVSHAC